LLAQASSELNNLLQIISGTTAVIEEALAGNETARDYLAVLRSSIVRAEKVAADLVKHAGGPDQTELMHPDLSGFIRPRNANGVESRYSILITDDEEMALILVKRILEAAGFRVTTASSGFQCIEIIRSHPYGFDLVLLDLTMPFMDGAETFRRLREIRNDLGVVLCTGFIQRDRLNQFMAEGLIGFLRKPIAADEIVSFVRATLANMKYSGGALESLPAAS
jgi:CheY-like chemotaxis protein